MIVEIKFVSNNLLSTSLLPLVSVFQCKIESDVSLSSWLIESLGNDELFWMEICYIESLLHEY